MFGKKIKRVDSLRLWGESKFQYHDRVFHLQVQDVFRGVVPFCQAEKAPRQAQ